MVEKKRIEWIDICKGILIITIVLMHISFSFWNDNTIGKYFGNLTSLYKVSIFFCVAGLTIKEERLKDIKTFILRKLKTLYSKMIVIGLVAVLLHNSFIKLGFYKNGADYAGKKMYLYHPINFIKQSLFTIFMANREVIIGPMWYAYVLFMALVILAIINKILLIIIKNDGNVRIIRLFVTISLMLISSLLTNVFHITIPRFNNTLTAVFLIDLCNFLYKYMKFKFNNIYFFIGCTLLFLNLPLYGYFSMNNNYFVNPAYLLAVSVTGMYVLYFISHKIANSGISKVLSYIGRQSFWI